MKLPMPAIVRGDARALPLPDEFVDLIVTSPPYFGLRSYTDNGEHYDGQIGSEPTPAEFIDALIECTREMVRVLKPGGSIFINLGDKYVGVADGRNNNGYGGGIIAATHSNPQISDRQTAKGDRFKVSFGELPYKSLCMIPERYRIACVDQLGLIARAVIVWSKVNGLPESVQDRVRRSHEDWVHLTKQPRYFAAVDEIREGYNPATIQRNRTGRNPHTPDAYTDVTRGVLRDSRPAGHEGNPLGKLPGSVWEIATQPLKVPAHLGVDHFAAYPMEWPRRLIQGWSPAQVCTGCGEGRRPVTSRSKDTYHGAGQWRSGRQQREDGAAEKGWAMDEKWSTTTQITGYACACPDTSAPSTPGVVLDPFGGTGTTALVATMLGRVGISVDLSLDYCDKVAHWRANDPKERARAAGLDPDAVTAIKAELPGQGSLLDLIDTDGEAS